MKIEKLSDCSVKIVLSQIDLYNYDIQYDDWDSDKATEFILSVADEITEKLGVDITREKLYVEIFSRIKTDVLFLYSVPASKLRRQSAENAVLSVHLMISKPFRNFAVLLMKKYRIL